MSEHIYEDSDMEHEYYHIIPFGSMREEIVRCRDCRAMRVKYGNTGIECWMNGEPFTVESDGFCAWACRKERTKTEQEGL